MKKQIIIDDLVDMKRFAEELSGFTFPGFVLCLEGDLGAGKTTFTKYFGKGLGIDDVINSPTFTIMKIYEGELPLYHMDVYRLGNALTDYDLEEYIYADGVSVIEWYRNIIYSVPEERLVIEITIVEDGKRQLNIEGFGKYEEIVEKINY